MNTEPNFYNKLEWFNYIEVQGLRLPGKMSDFIKFLKLCLKGLVGMDQIFIILKETSFDENNVCPKGCSWLVKISTYFIAVTRHPTNIMDIVENHEIAVQVITESHTYNLDDTLKQSFPDLNIPFDFGHS
ncbi:hypothetical protein NPIL_542641 [Nephila pilipes]|uniref:Uncharacterized protein n=1 Tax=Nephila pilipes TaxID=299642 RepID=A0A8X6PXQ3_NEPPI|nr:hypothetical protein NPIL_542641 [Nephila pilipes]